MRRGGVAAACGAVALLLLAGCQQTAHKPAPPLQAQLDHIALMLAGGHFLRVACGRSEVPDDVKLQRTAMRTAQHRGWDTHAAGYRQLPALTQARYLALQQDNQLLTDKCATLSRSTARFIAAAQADQEDYME
ncbi:TPA: type II secretion system pilot lipoprotein GspS [Serratia marcescens]|nr:type II secretion system pilot lipoprotein GspS [Serratia marcescens]NDJ09283.1 type II secretion system pilot lipoprotein GspS [Serratia marcescens]NDJ29370.1 type II secretion system pilot lipoprotein GspS [Serratia marcescens]NDJ43297.1 type II secretion system pilot lipoprotein GspS [Serratia marcescens]NDJ50861.1 type II secretion system pilot lipoprotein GspS [Serratia marcescens]